MEWEGAFWTSLETACRSYPMAPSKTEARDMYEYVRLVCLSIPEGEVRARVADLLATSPVQPFLDSRPDVMRWLAHIREKVRAATGDPDALVPRVRGGARSTKFQGKMLTLLAAALVTVTLVS